VGDDKVRKLIAEQLLPVKNECSVLQAPVWYQSSEPLAKIASQAGNYPQGGSMLEASLT